MKKTLILTLIILVVAIFLFVTLKEKRLSDTEGMYPTGLQSSSEEDLKDVPFVEDNIDNIPTFQ
jgi:hypothetical protein